MPENSKISVGAPRFLPCDPLARFFPPGWKDYYFSAYGRFSSETEFVYSCPICRGTFDHTDIDFLEGDHIWPYSMFGETSWENYQLLCGRCNASKKNFIDREIRAELGRGEFRRRVLDYLKELHGQQKIIDSDQARHLLGLIQTTPSPGAEKC